MILGTPFSLLPSPFSLLLSPLLLQVIIDTLLGPGFPLVCVIDETLERRYAPQISVLGIYRDPVRSSRKKMIPTPAVRWICLSVVIPLPWCSREWALPFFTAPLVSRKVAQELGIPYKTCVARAAQMISLIRRWQPDLDIIVAGDAAYASTVLIQRCQRKRISPPRGREAQCYTRLSFALGCSSF